MDAFTFNRRNGRYIVPSVFVISTLLLVSLIFMLNGTAGAALLPEAEVASPTAPLTRTLPAFADVYVSPHADEGAVTYAYQAVYGPYLCPIYGDPFSTLNSPWEPGIYTYTYRIMIPPDYVTSHEILRIELLDPDSWAAPGGSADVTHTVTAVAAGMNPVEYNMPANSSSRSTNSFVNTGEGNLIGAVINGITVTEEMINPWWFVRMDVHDGSGYPPGNGSCGHIFPYNMAYNSETRYQLYYYHDNGDGTVEQVELSTYTGQTGREAVQDNHDTNLRWVSPALSGVDQRSFDQTVDVPVDAGSAAGFQLNITDNSETDVPNIATDPDTGARYIYMSVTAISGSTQNGYELWAGPPEYTATVPSNLNHRNVYLADNPDSHTADGVIFYAVGRLPMKAVTLMPATVPLMHVGSEYAGETIYVTQYDSDTGASPPIIFYFDTLDFEHDPDCDPWVSNSVTIHPDGYCDGVDWTQTAWALSFGNYQDNVDPDGLSGRCQPGTCTTRWVNPAYEIEVPGDLINCNKRALPPDGNINADPDSKTCVLFSGGRLMSYYRTGRNDVYGWQLSLTAGDTTPPLIGEPVYPTYMPISQSITVTVNISDALTGNNGVLSAKLHFSYMLPYTGYSVSGTGPGGNGDGVWTFVIPAQGADRIGEEIGFWLEAQDADVTSQTAVSDNNGAYYRISIADDDTTYPIFSDLSYPAVIDGTELPVITVNISDTINGHGIMTATLYYSYAYPYNQSIISGTGPGGDGNGLWSFTLPAQGAAREGDELSFWLSATDGDDTPRTAVDNNDGAYYPITVTDDDITAPIFTNLSYPDTASSADSFIVTVNISDTVDGHGISRSVLHYGYAAPYTQYEFYGTGPGGDGNGTWTFNIPAQGATHEGEVFTFWLSAMDGDDTPITAVDNNNGAYYPINITDDDTAGPTFSDLSYPAAITSTEPFTISVMISDTIGNHGVVSATLHYGYADPDEFEIVGAGPVGNGNGVWTFNIPAQGAAREGETLSFWLSAVDGDNSGGTAVDNNNGAYYPINIIDDDTAGPTFSDLSYPAAITSTEPFTISVTISDTIGNHGVVSATLHYGYADPDEFEIVGTGPGGNGDGVWTFNVPAQGVAREGEIFTFWLSAVDGDNSGETAVDNNNGAYYPINIISYTYLPLIVR